MGWPKGKPRGEKTPGSGRRHGSRNKRADGIEEYARGIVEDPQVQAQIKHQAQTGLLPAPILSMLFHYAYGKPRENREDLIDNLAFMQALVSVVAKHANSGEAQREVYAVIEAHLGRDRLRSVA